MAHVLLPGLYAVLLWWFSTGVIIYLDLLPRRTHGRSFAAYSVLTVLCLAWLIVSRGEATPAGAYAAFSASLLCWGWLEISFYMGFVTGPRAEPCPPGCTGLARLRRVLGVSLWHELAIAAGAGLIAVLSRGAPNKIGLWSFLILWLMHESARLNVLLGVRNIATEFVPDHLAFLRSFLRRRRMNPLFPFSLLIGGGLVYHLATAALAPGATRFSVVGLALLASLASLGLAEHVFLMLPVDFAKLWRWSLIARRGNAAPDAPSGIWNDQPLEAMASHTNSPAGKAVLATAAGRN